MRWKCLSGQGKGEGMVGIAGVLLIGALAVPLVALVAGMVGLGQSCRVGLGGDGSTHSAAHM